MNMVLPFKCALKMTKYTSNNIVNKIIKKSDLYRENIFCKDNRAGEATVRHSATHCLYLFVITQSQRATRCLQVHVCSNNEQLMQRPSTFKK